MSVQQTTNNKQSPTKKFMSALTDPKYLGVIGVATAGITYVAAKQAGLQRFSDVKLSTEQAVSSFSLLAGVGGAAAQLIAGQRLSRLDADKLPVTKMALPLGISIMASAGSAFLLPTEA